MTPTTKETTGNQTITFSYLPNNTMHIKTELKSEHTLDTICSKEVLYTATNSFSPHIHTMTGREKYQNMSDAPSHRRELIYKGLLLLGSVEIQLAPADS